jgi:Spy/CpxP family protein refolding chaperone
MKITLKAMLVSVMAVTSVAVVAAQKEKGGKKKEKAQPATEQSAPATNAPRADQRQESGGHGGFSVKDRVERLKTELGLTGAQADSLTKIYTSTRAKMQAGNLTQEQRRGIVQSEREQVNAILTPEQLAKHKELQAKRDAERAAKRNR